MCECTCSYVQVILKARDVMCSQRHFVCENCEFKFFWRFTWKARKPEWSQLQLDLFLIFIWTYNVLALSALCDLCTLCILASDPTDHMIISDKGNIYITYHSYYGMLWMSLKLDLDIANSLYFVKLHKTTFFYSRNAW